MAQCTAHAKQSGIRCKQPAIPGGHVCRYHGGSAPQVRQAAALRLASLVDPAIAKLAKIVTSKAKKVDALTFRAIQDVLDRNNMKGDAFIRMLNPDAGPPQVEVTEEMLARMETLSPDELTVFLRVLGLLNSPGPVDSPRPPQLTQ